MTPRQTETERRTYAVLVDNEPGVLARVIGLFSGRGYNIESLTVTEVDLEQHLSRITIITSGTPQVLTQIRAQGISMEYAQFEKRVSPSLLDVVVATEAIG